MNWAAVAVVTGYVAIGCLFVFRPRTTREPTWCDNVQTSNGCPGPARLEHRDELGRGTLVCHCDAWERVR